jgi:hypothetical protein
MLDRIYTKNKFDSDIFVRNLVQAVHDIEHFTGLVLTCMSRGSSGSIVSGYGLDDRAIEVRSSAAATDFSSNLCVQTGSGAHPASCTMDTGGRFSGIKARPERDADHSPPHLVRRMSRSYNFYPKRFRSVLWDSFSVYLYFSSSFCVQTGSGAHPASCTMGTEGPFLGGKAGPGRDADHSPPCSAEVEKNRSSTTSPSKRLRDV